MAKNTRLLTDKILSLLAFVFAKKTVRILFVSQVSLGKVVYEGHVSCNLSVFALLEGPCCSPQLISLQKRVKNFANQHRRRLIFFRRGGGWTKNIIAIANGRCRRQRVEWG